MTDALNPRTPSRWPFLVVIAALAVLGLVWLANPSGDREGQVEDPIVTQQFEDPADATPQQAFQVETTPQDSAEPVAE